MRRRHEDRGGKVVERRVGRAGHGCAFEIEGLGGDLEWANQF